MFGLRQLKPVLHITRKDTPGVPIFGIFGSQLQEFKIAWLGAGDSVGLEIFEFIDPCHRKPEIPGFDYALGGFFHIAMTVSEPLKKRDEVIQAGGRQLGEAALLPRGNQVTYCMDPWGNAIELLPCGFQTMVENGGGED